MLISVNGPRDQMVSYDWGNECYALAHECLKSQEAVEYYREHRDGRSMILDNGADELGVGMSGEELRYLIGAFEPTLVILPDVLKNGPVTVFRSDRFLAE